MSIYFLVVSIHKKNYTKNMSYSELGKKVFFLYPHSVIESDLLVEFIRNEFEIYTLKDHQKVKLLLKKYPDSILFINIDEHLNEKEWFEYVESITESDEYPGVQVGILTYNENEELAQKYLLDLSVTCGFIQLKLGKEESKQIIVKTLEANESKGKRKYIRATAANSKGSGFNVKIGTELRTGIINDISSVGMSCIFHDGIELSKNALLSKMQLKLNSRLILVDGIVFGSRVLSEKETLYVVMFTNSITEDSKTKIHKFIGEAIQSSMEDEIKEIYG